MIHGFDYFNPRWKLIISSRIKRAEVVYSRNEINKVIFGSCTLGDREQNEKIYRLLNSFFPIIGLAIKTPLAKTTVEEYREAFNYIEDKDSLFIVSDICHIGRCTVIAWKMARNQNKIIEISAYPSDVPYLTSINDPLSRSPDNYLFNA